MPEYSHIQTYLKCDQFNFKDVIKQFSQVVNSLGLDSKYFSDELELEFSDNGFMYVGGGAEGQLYDHNGYQLHLRPYVLGWTPEVIDELGESYLEVSILFRTEEIELDWRTGQLRSQYQSLVWRIMSKFSKEYKQTGVYFTNEVTDGVPWEALVSGNKERLWEFDAAILPAELIDVYRDYPAEMFVCMHEKVMFIARKSVWRTEPWRITQL